MISGLVLTIIVKLSQPDPGSRLHGLSKAYLFTSSSLFRNEIIDTVHISSKQSVRCFVATWLIFW